jgi:hypothetical protein
MAATKANATLLSAVTTTQTSSPQDVSTDYAQEAFVKVVQVGTATTAATVQIQVSSDGGTTYYSPPTLLFTAGLAAATYDQVFILPASTQKVQAVFTQQSGGTSSTCTVQLGQVTGI